MISDQTVIKDEEYNETSLEDIKRGQKVLVNPPRDDSFEGHPNEIIFLEMTYEEKYSRLLPHTDGMNIVIMYRENEPVPSELQETMYERAMNILEGTEYRATAGWVPYDNDYVVDFKEELDIEQFPVILVFDGKELIFKGYSDEDLYDFFRTLTE